MALISDPIADYIIRLRNAQMAGHRIVEIPSSKLKQRITEILYNEGYILRYKFESLPNNKAVIQIAIKYDLDSKKPTIKHMKRVSRPGLRRYVGSDNLPSVINGLGTAIISTSKGLLTDKVARKENVGGEVLFYIY
jgi:small subunit ribosomal protein S8